jgi:hypothetical protein
MKKLFFLILPNFNQNQSKFMKTIYSFIGCLILLFGTTPLLMGQNLQAVDPHDLAKMQDVQMTNEVIRIGKATPRHIQNAPRANTSFKMDYDSLSNNDARFFWRLNSRFNQPGNMTYALVTYDSLVSEGGVGYNYDAHTVIVDSIDVALGHSNGSNQEDTVVISIIELAPDGYFTPNVLWSDSVFSNVSITPALNIIPTFRFYPDFALCTGRFGVRVDFHGPTTDTLAVLAGLQYGNCQTTSCPSGGPGAASPTSIIWNSYYGYYNGPNFLELPTPAGGNLYRDCTGDSQFDADSCENWFIQDFLFAAHVSITDVPVPQPTVTVTTTPDNGSGNGTAWVDVSGTFAGYTLEWLGGATTDTITGLSAGPVSVVVQTGLGCPIVPGNSIVESNVGIEEELQAGISQFETFPNPTSDQIALRIELDQIDDVQIRLFDLNGKVVFTDQQNKVNRYSRSVSLADFGAGVYLLEVETTKGRATKRVVVL